VEWYHKAAEQGDAEAQYNLGFCYYKGLGVKRDYKLAKSLIEKSAGQGFG
jgi:TPR repeat protein